MLQSATLTPFRAPVLAISHVHDLFIFRPKIFENLSKTSMEIQHVTLI